MVELTEYTTLFLIIALGLILGKISFRGVALGPSAVIFAAILLGHFGMSVPEIFKHVGLILFMYSIGIQAGPGFFEIFKNKKKLGFLYLTFLVIMLEAGLTLMFKHIFGYDNATAAGLFNGALSSSAGLAAAASGENSEIVSAVFGLAYPFGVLLIILFMVLAPKIFKVNIKDEETKYLKAAKAENPDIIERNYVLENPNLFGKTIAESRIRDITKATISRIFYGDREVVVSPDTELKEGCIVFATGTPAVHKELKIIIGEQKKAELPKREIYEVKQALVTNKAIIGMPIKDVGLDEEHGAHITQIRRSGVDIIPRAHIKLRFGDKLTIACPKNKADIVMKTIGDSRSKMHELDLLPISIGILFGVLLSRLTLPIAGFVFKFGLTGGVLLAGLILGRIGKTGSLIWNVVGTPNLFLRKLGLMFFLAAVGTEAGEHFIEMFRGSGIELIISAIVIVLVPLFAVALIGHKRLKLDFLTVLGILTGSMTSTPGLSSIENMSDTNAARVAYASVYPFALVLVILASQMFMKF